MRHIVEGYRDSSEAAFERQFERDKEELRGLGIDVQTGSNDILFDDEEGYRINRVSFELPEIAFTAAELSALALAGQVWQDSVAADHTAQAFEALSAGGAAPDPALVPTVRPHLSVVEPDFDVLYDAVLRRVEVEFGYGGRPRRVQPWRMLQRRGRWYVFGFDPVRVPTASSSLRASPRLRGRSEGGCLPRAR
ncbi:WYL domain-containing protein [Tessaracoccus sp. HDW20]|nr:WYL domain-containing protein [Tessaracoccus coleopterorum]